MAGNSASIRNVAAPERYFERRQIKAALEFARSGGIAIHRNFDSYDGHRSPRGFVMHKPFLHVIGKRAQLAEWGLRWGLRPEWIQPEKRREVAHYDIFGDLAQRLIDLHVARQPGREPRADTLADVNPVLATGSVAFDYILTFGGHFRDHILPDQIHMINLSFLVETFERRRGGVAANYAYNLALLGHPAAILATAGADAALYRDWLAGRGIDVSGLRIMPDEHTATGFTTTDLDHNQITGYYGGAMNRAGEIGLADTGVTPSAVIVGPNAPAAMQRLVSECREAAIPFVFDPAHQLPHMTKADLEEGCRGAWITIGNDYELELIRQRTGRDVAALLELSEMVVTTLGRDGSRIETAAGRFEIPAAAPRIEVDPTGAGDSYRAGLVAGLLRGLPAEEAGRVASLAATWVVEQAGTIEHDYSLPEFAERYRVAFGVPLPDAFAAS